MGSSSREVGRSAEFCTGHSRAASGAGRGWACSHARRSTCRASPAEESLAHQLCMRHMGAAPNAGWGGQAEAGLGLIGHAEACRDRLASCTPQPSAGGGPVSLNLTMGKPASCAGQGRVLTAADGEQIPKGGQVKKVGGGKGEIQWDLRTGKSKGAAPLPSIWQLRTGQR